MAWDGNIYRSVLTATSGPDGGSRVRLDCGHVFYTAYPPHVVLPMLFRRSWHGNIICEECSQPHRDAIAKIQAGIKFDDVIERLRNLGRIEDLPTPSHGQQT